ncbi:uncharacterized protein LOC127281659 isoform X2 [Leptopilina boulardi]|uniref:uncharacterized protein LOC127281659 isoform X2 n=1 Tax=Leptopilina boulardi TaxID=63433 RepID=UPI0021F5D121|nr:uncharacterized protein LOC127281659 isoform X2 [Leptopilina boulardi]
MELVLSPGFIGDNDGSPFHNEDVHEWSHVDQLTGMLENARIETGRWQTKNERSAQSYGKVVDSRERNSADGNVVQRAQRKVEVFQSQGTGGKSIQVVRASQWSSSRVSDLIHSSSLAKSPIEQHMSDLDSGIKSRLNDYKNFDSLSSLCRKLHSKVINDSHSLFFGQNSAFLTDEKLSKAFEVIDRNKSLFNENKKSNSNEDLASLTDEKESLSPLNFTRDYRTRRSLQLVNKKNGKDSTNSHVKLADLNNSERDLYVSKLSELKNPQARLRTKVVDDDEKFVKNSYSSPESSPRNSYFSGKHSPETNLTFNKTNVSNASKPRTYFYKDHSEKNRESIVEIQKPTSIRLCSQDTTNRSNKTIVHLGKSEDETTGHIKVTIDLKNTPKNDITSRDSNSQENILFLSDCSTKPTKKVGFCKTEVHFVADSGKVNIVETDGKPPPTNRFRRRRRNNNSNNGLGISANKNLPVVHFGDTPPSYIFGENKKSVNDELLSNTTKLREDEDAWQSFKSPLTMDNENDTKKNIINESNLTNIHEKNLDHRHKGHTTTVNFGSNGFCNLKNIIQDDTSRLSNVEEVSLEAPKIISALDLRTRKENHNSPSLLENELAITSEDSKSFVKTTAIQRPIIAKVDFDHSQKLLKSSKKPTITLASLYPIEKSNEEAKLSSLSTTNEIEKIPHRSTKSNETERISLRLAKLNNESEKISPCLLNSNESEKILSPSMKLNEKQSMVKLSETEKCSHRFVKLNDVGKISTNLMKTNENVKDCCAVPISEAKDFCDVNSSGVREENCDPSPIYVNVFESNRNDVPIYENSQAVQNSFETEVASKKKLKENENQEKVQQPSKIDQEELSKKLHTHQSKSKSINSKLSSEIRNSGSESNKSSLIRRSKRETVDSKKEKKQNSDNVKNKSNKIIEKESNNKLKEQKIKEKSQEDGILKNSKSALVKKDLKRTTSKSRNSKQSSELEIEKNTKPETSKIKKPVEVVYKTAIYNMKNEKLTKPAKTKETKGPRYINDIICGSKVKKSSSTDKHGKTNVTSQSKKS